MPRVVIDEYTGEAISISSGGTLSWGDPGGTLSWGDPGYDQCIQNKYHRAALRKKVVNSDTVIIGAADIQDQYKHVLGEDADIWEGVRAVALHFASAGKRVWCVIHQTLLHALPADIKDVLDDIIPTSGDKYRETLLGIASEGKELFPFLMNGVHGKSDVADNIQRVNPRLRIEFTFSKKGRLHLLSDIDAVMKSSKALSSAGSDRRTVSEASSQKDSDIVAACAGKQHVHTTRRVVLSYDGLEKAEDGIDDEIGYMAVDVGDEITVRSEPQPGHQGNKFKMYVYARSTSENKKGWVPLDIFQAVTSQQCPLPAHHRTAPLEEFEIGSSSGSDDGAQITEANNHWTWYGGKWWQIAQDGTWHATDGTIWRNADVSSWAIERLHVPNLGFAEDVQSHIDELGQKLSEHGLRLKKYIIGEREVATVPAILDSINEEEQEEQDEVAKWCLVYADIEGRQTQLQALKNADIKIALTQPEGLPLELKFLPNRKKRRAHPGQRRVAIPRRPHSTDYTSDTAITSSSSDRFERRSPSMLTAYESISGNATPSAHPHLLAPLRSRGPPSDMTRPTSQLSVSVRSAASRGRPPPDMTRMRPASQLSVSVRSDSIRVD